MRSLMLLIVFIGGLALTGSPSHASPPTDAAAETPAAESARAEDRPAQQAKAEVEAKAKQDEFRPPEGFKKRMRNGNEVYCRKVAPAGSRIERTECFTQAQVESMEEAQRAYREDLRNQGLICADARCNGA